MFDVPPLIGSAPEEAARVALVAGGAPLLVDAQEDPRRAIKPESVELIIGIRNHKVARSASENDD